jgi:hypothetical protein
MLHALELTFARTAGTARAFRVETALAIRGIRTLAAVAFGPISAAVGIKAALAPRTVCAGAAVALHTRMAIRIEAALAIVLGQG